ncbi:hypothetical protein BDV34DRAFT_192526 [Aspergillus parasiticus]|uniref:Uncharacterized protein n=1 Tax=Aspergillus parasiticus TaxID=5067 RepID=A0A5N6DQ78_ASPPA|nr:hypothetical protein BDV34DRAFT_192526 [Aspergillus parasiticus]
MNGNLPEPVFWKPSGLIDMESDEPCMTSNRRFFVIFFCFLFFFETSRESTVIAASSHPGEEVKSTARISPFSS